MAGIGDRDAQQAVTAGAADASGTVTLDALTTARLDAEAALAQARRAEERLREALEILPEGIVFLNSDGRYILWNQKYAEMYAGTADLFHEGARLEETLRIGVSRGNYPDAAGREEEWIAQRMAHLQRAEGRHEQKLKDGRTILIQERRTKDGGIIGLRVDVTEMKAREESFRLLFAENPVPMFVHALDDDRILAVNEAAEQHYGFSAAELLGMRLSDLRVPERDIGTPKPSEPETGTTWRQRKSNGEEISVVVYARDLPYEGRPAALLAMVDITERQRAEQRVAFMAHHDALTGLPNRTLFRERVAQALRLNRRDEMVGMLCIDLDDFKAVNDTFGHPTGDHLLQLVTMRLRDEVRETDTVARLGGDEFAILQTGIANPEDASALAGRLVQAVSAPYEIDGHIISVGISVGIALGPGDGADCERLLKSADMALYRSKTEGRGTYCFFETGMDARLQARRRMEFDLRHALATEAFEVHYQPLVTLATGVVSGFEALARWNHPEIGEISPADFIPVCEEMGLITSLGAYVLRRACRDAAAWPDDIKVAVNLSPIQFRAGNLFAVVADALKTSGLAPQRLELEITETLLLEKSEHVLATLHALRALGVRISMDDFGTGYSSLSYLRSFPFDKIKIDRSFVSNLTHNPDSQAIVRAILSLGASLGITITAEGVENESDLACLKAEGCPEGQGFLFARALPAPSAAALLAAPRPQPDTIPA
ncbi:putative bifunctional diguanylate cyclase/phosphodiesterase [Terrihabitans sp. B22-R8]|uniref:putative bifunctional diguanylate cyclase/phosphodiesterase n=1 Tax=Terrihabitans sp. B22-R8 TaxID=3425128 RepID=UPI00403CC09F